MFCLSPFIWDKGRDFQTLEGIRAFVQITVSHINISSVGPLQGIWVPPVKFVCANIAQICQYDFFIFFFHYADPPQIAEKLLPFLRKLEQGLDDANF